VTNGDFASGTGWTAGAGWAIGSGVATATASSGTLTSTLTATIAKVYRVVYTLATATAGSVQVSLGGVTGVSRTTAGTYTEYLTASSTAALVFTGTGFSGTLDNIEVVDVSDTAVTAPYGLQYDGIDDFLTTASVNFATATSDGLARRNLLTFPSVFDNADWSKLAVGGGTAPVVTENAGTAPDGTTTADKVVFVAPVSGDISLLSQAPAVSAGTYAGSLYVKADGAGDVGKIIAFRHVAAGASLLVTLTSSWQRIEKTEVYAVSSFEIILRPSIGTSSGTVSVQLWGAQLEAGTTASTFQDIGTDKMAVVMGVRKLSDSAQGIVAELTASLAANNGSFYLAAPNSAAANFAFASKGTISATDVETGFAAPLTAVITGIGNIAGDSAQLRTNGVAGTAVITDQGTGNYSNAVLYFGRRGGASLPYNGLDFGGICVNKTLTASQLANAERWTAIRTGITF
jgi:hypothetical protein